MAEVYAIVLTVVCIVFSGLFSGLTLGLLSLDLTDLRVYIDSGTPNEQRHARRIYPIRKKGNHLLVSLLVGNTSVNSALSILSAGIFNGVVGFVVSTITILYLGEIVPQAVCHKYGLVIGYYTAPLVYVLMVITWPIAWPTAKILNWVLGSETELRYTKKEIKSLVNIHADAQAGEAPQFSVEERTILGSAIDFWSKEVKAVMTPLDKVFMLDVETPLNFTTMTQVFQSGHSRVPIYENSRSNIVGVIFAKDLILLDPDDDILVKTVMNLFNREIRLVFDDTRLGELLADFKTGRGHLALVKRVNDTGEGDPFYETVGLVTLEDLIEELIGSEIVDETDVYEDNQLDTRVKRERRFDPHLIRLFDSAARRADSLNKNELDVVQNFLSRNVKEFAPELITGPVLRRLLRHCEILEYTDEHQLALRLTRRKGESVEDSDYDTDAQRTRPLVLYRQGIETDEALLVLQGRLKLTVGSEGFLSEIGPWTLIARHALAQTSYKPDFSAETLELPVRLVKISRTNYRIARRLSSRSRGAKAGGSYGMKPGSVVSTTSESSDTSQDNNDFVDPPTTADLLEKLATVASVSDDGENGKDGHIVDLHRSSPTTDDHVEGMKSGLGTLESSVSSKPASGRTHEMDSSPENGDDMV